MPYVLIFLGILLLIVLWFVAMYNGLVRLRMKTDEAFSTMDVYLKKRFDLIPNLVETVKGYAKHEKETFENITRARAMVGGATSDDEKIKAEKEFGSAVSRLLMVTENYPELKTNTNFLKMQDDLKEIEQEIASSRKYYNGVCGSYNTKTLSIPTNIIANMFGFTQKPFFEVADSNERENVKVQF